MALEIIVYGNIIGSQTGDLRICNGGVGFEPSHDEEDSDSHPKLIFVSPQDIEDFEKVHGVTLPLFPSLKHRKAYASIRQEPELITKPWLYHDWHNALSRKRYLQEVQMYGAAMESVISGLDVTYWREFYCQRFKNLLCRNMPWTSTGRACQLGNSFVDGDRLHDLIKSSAAVNKHTLRTFQIVDKDDLAAMGVLGVPSEEEGSEHLLEFFPPTYTLSNTRTGRMTITDGPDILTLKREYRDILLSKFGGEGKLWYLDFSSLEPRILLILSDMLQREEADREKTLGNLSPTLSLIGNVPQRSASKDIPEDIYSKVLEDLGLLGEVPRHIAKTAILSLLYGQGEATTAETLKSFISKPEEFISAVSDYFGVETLKRKLAADFVKSNGKQITSYYGRPIQCDDAAPYVLLNYYIQSTAVTVALLGFGSIINRLKDNDLLGIIRPVFFLHDALILDVHNDAEHLIPKLEKLGSTGIPKFKAFDFYLKAQTLSSLLQATTTK